MGGEGGGEGEGEGGIKKERKERTADSGERCWRGPGKKNIFVSFRGPARIARRR